MGLCSSRWLLVLAAVLLARGPSFARVAERRAQPRRPPGSSGGASRRELARASDLPRAVGENLGRPRGNKRLQLQRSAWAGDFEAAVAALARVESAGGPFSDVELAYILRYFWPNHPEGAERWMAMLLERGQGRLQPNAHQIMMEGYADAGNPQRSEEWFNNAVAGGIATELWGYRAMILACSNAGDADGTERWIRRAQADGFLCGPGALRSIIRACRMSGDIARAEAVQQRAEQLSDCPPLGFWQKDLLAVAAEAPDGARAAECYFEQRVAKTHGRLDASDYHAMLRAYGKSGRVQGAVQMFQDMVRAGAGPDATSLQLLRAAVGPEMAEAVCRNLRVSLAKVQADEASRCAAAAGKPWRLAWAAKRVIVGPRAAPGRAAAAT